MGIDSFYKKNSDDRTPKAIDLQWSKENEAKEIIYGETEKLRQVQKRIDNIEGKTSGNLEDVSLRIDKLLVELDIVELFLWLSLIYFLLLLKTH